ncbi:putative RNA-directed DNA polymerase from transposon X-element [Trichonephila clavipes]|uniref:Putative RNA-directed DNA polymerase from transposon X-element n=1 Tax=Trichonephila clavipes TaxID=2585209 RepID=A0A8X6RF04_TRICX|nr:putative RNA-directed DNA polymerase from transposon X-element [Trichonephila clavipes]
MWELKRALSSAHNTSPGPDRISDELLRHLNKDSLVSLLYLFYRIWREQMYPTQWQEAIVIPILKPGKDPKNPPSYQPIALTSCLCKTLERMINARLVYQLEKNRCIPLYQSGFLSIFFDIEKAYDRTWCYGILRTLFTFGLRGNLPTLINNFLNLRTFRASLYVDDLQISCEGSDMRMIERQLQTTVNNIVKWCDTNGHSISASKSCCVHFCRKRVLSNTSWGADQTSLLRVYQSVVLSRMDYGCAIYGSACNSALKKLDPVHHMALRICSDAFRTSSVQSLYVTCNQLPLDLRRRKLSLAYYFKILSMPSHPLKNVFMSTIMKRLYDARPSNIRPFMERMKRLTTELDLPIVNIQQRNFLLFKPWNTPTIPLYQTFCQLQQIHCNTCHLSTRLRLPSQSV